MSTPTRVGGLDIQVSQANFHRLQRIAASKCFGLSGKVTSNDDVFQEVCESALRLAERVQRPLNELINNQVFWRTGEYCRRARAHSQRSQSISDILGAHTSEDEDDGELVSLTDAMFPSIESGYESVDVQDLLRRVNAGIPTHLVRVAESRIAGLTNEQIAIRMSCPVGTVQFHWESYKRRAREILANHGFTSFDQIQNTALSVAA